MPVDCQRRSGLGLRETKRGVENKRMYSASVRVGCVNGGLMKMEEENVTLGTRQRQSEIDSKAELQEDF